MQKDYEKINLERLWSFIETIRSERIVSNDDFVDFSWDDERFIGLGDISELITGLQAKDAAKICEIGLRNDETYGYNLEDGFVGNYFGLEIISEKFDELYKRIQNEIIRLNEIEDKKPIYEIHYKLGKIYLNNDLIANPNFNSENELVFDYLYNHPNKRVTKDELEKNCLEENGHFKKPLKDIIRGLGFAGDIKEMFFLVSEKGVYFKNPIYKKDIDLS